MARFIIKADVYGPIFENNETTVVEVHKGENEIQAQHKINLKYNQNECIIRKIYYCNPIYNPADDKEPLK